MEKETLEIMKQKMEQVADILYKGNTEQGIAAMIDVLPYLLDLSNCIDDENTQRQFIDDALQPLLVAMENNDGTLMADIITYELIGRVDDMIAM